MRLRGFSNMIKPGDIIITLLLVLLSFLPVVIFSSQQADKTANASGFTAVIKVNNEEVERVALTGNTEHDIFDIHTSETDYNTIEVRGESIRIKGANCYDQVCVQFGFISKPGETIVCLPHRLVIEIEANNDNGDTDDEMIIST